MHVISEFGQDTSYRERETKIEEALPQVSRDLLNMVCRMDTEKVENQFALQCAPLIAGIKMSVLLRISNEQIARLNTLLEVSRIAYYVMAEGKEKSTLFLYNRDKLPSYMGEKRVKGFMQEFGYPTDSLEKMLSHFRCRYRMYDRGEGRFPHEIGVLLGYPLEDVKGFMVHGGKNALYTGYWKVYHDVEKTRKLFRMYELAKELLIELLNNGVEMTEILAIYRECQKM